MADNRREQERNELYRTIWALANDLTYADATDILGLKQNPTKRASL